MSLQPLLLETAELEIAHTWCNILPIIWGPGSHSAVCLFSISEGISIPFSSLIKSWFLPSDIWTEPC